MAARPKILVTGGRGQLGTDLASVLSDEYEVEPFDLPEFDVCDRALVLRCLESSRPEIVLHSAAFTDVDGCESDRVRAMAVNQLGTQNVAEACRTIGARLIYFSTDYVFDGFSDQPYRETDKPNPQSVYGLSKLGGEKAVQETAHNYAIIRIGWVYGQHGKNFVKTMAAMGHRQLLESKSGVPVKPLQVVDDQYGSPTWTLDIVRQTAALLSDNWQGIYHSTSLGETTWCQFAEQVMAGLRLNVDLRPCTTAALGRPAPRPKRSTLANSRLDEAGNNLMRDWQDGLAEFVTRFGKGLLR